MRNVQIHNNTVNEKFTMVQAHADQVEGIMNLLLEVAQWLKRQGSNQWNGLLQGEDSHNTVGSIERGEVFACLDGDQIAGMVILMHKPSEWDRKLWGTDAHLNDGAIYLHRLAIKRKYANSGLGKEILHWCESEVDFPDKRLIRLDCVRTNQKLNRFYQSSGYTYMGEKDGYNLYEKGVSYGMKP